MEGGGYCLLYLIIMVDFFFLVSVGGLVGIFLLCCWLIGEGIMGVR